ncbi:MAG: hypothetical protein J5680_04620, partial [Neisseriaceae bacterium]|nr:hypothetical protein [Neisseriaceae bacterium]
MGNAQLEFDETAAKYGGEVAYNLAKADGKTELTYKQWVQVRTPSFKAWFGDWENDPKNASKVVNPDTGEPLVVYHGSGEEFFVFDKSKATDKQGRQFNVGTGKGVFSFTNDYQSAENWKNNAKNRQKYGVKSVKPTVISAFLNIKNPINRVEFDNRVNLKIGEVVFLTQKVRDKAIAEVRRELKREKIDGIIASFGEYSAFEPNQIKSATDNIGTFDIGNPDIRYDLMGLPENNTAEMKQTLRIAKCLQGEPVAVLNDRLAPQGIRNLREWAIVLFENEFNGKAVNSEIGEILLNERSVRDTIAHGINPFKAEAFRSIKQVIEQGVVIAKTKVGDQDHFFISAPVTIENKEDIVTVLVRKDTNSQRMYLHSVITQESILEKAQKQEKENLLSSKYPKADTEVSEQNGKLRTGDISKILQKYLTVNIHELEKELKIMENQQVSGSLNEQTAENGGFSYYDTVVELDKLISKINKRELEDMRSVNLYEISERRKQLEDEWQLQSQQIKHSHWEKGIDKKPLAELSLPELQDKLLSTEYSLYLSEQNFAFDYLHTDKEIRIEDMKRKIQSIKNEIEHRKQQEVQPAAANDGVSLSNTQSEKENAMDTQNDTLFNFNNGYTVVIRDYFEQEIKENNGRVDDFTQVYIYHKDRITPVAEYWYSVDCLDSEKWAFNQDSVESRSEFVLNKENENPTSAMDYVQEPYGHRKSFSVNILGNPNWKEDLACAMVDFAVSYEVKTGLNADKEVSGSPEIVSVTRDNYYAANRYYAQNTAQNPIFLEKIDNRHQPVMPFDDFVAAVMKDTGDSRDEVVELASEAFRSQYQAASGYLRGVSDGSVMYNAFDIEIDDKTYYATAPLEWVKEQARATLSDRGWDLENARHNFLHSSIADNKWETAFNALKAAADDYRQCVRLVCEFFDFRQPEITLHQDEWSRVAQFVGYKQEWEQLDNARLLIAEFTPQQALEFHGLYNQYMQYQVLADKNMEQGIDTTVIDNQIAAIEQSLNEKVAQNLPQIENRQVMFDLFGTQLGLFDEETQEQGISASENSVETQPETLSMEEFDRRFSGEFGGEDGTIFQNHKMYEYYNQKDGVNIYHPNGLMNRPLETLSFSELEDRYEVLDYHFNAETP